MTDLRDARFKRALDHAPDAALRPDQATRQAIKIMATKALEKGHSGRASEPVRAKWWRRIVHWWTHPSAGSNPMPWNAALATVLLASLVTVLWYEQPVPQALPDDAPRQGPGRSEADSAAMPPAANVPSPAVTNDQNASQTRELKQPTLPPKRDAVPVKPQAGAAAESLAKAGKPLGAVKSERTAAPEAWPAELRDRAAEPGKDQAAKMSAPPAAVLVPQSPQSGAASTAPAAPAPVVASAPIPSMVPAPAAAKAGSSRSEVAVPEPGLARRHADADRAAPASPARTDWSDLSVQRVGSPSSLSSAQASRLLALVQMVSLQNVEPDHAGAPALLSSIRLDLSRRGEHVASLELGDHWVRWTPAGANHPRLAGRASTSQWVAIQAELARLGLLTP